MHPPQIATLLLFFLFFSTGSCHATTRSREIKRGNCYRHSLVPRKHQDHGHLKTHVAGSFTPAEYLTMQITEARRVLAEEEAEKQELGRLRKEEDEQRDLVRKREDKVTELMRKRADKVTELMRKNEDEQLRSSSMRKGDKLARREEVKLKRKKADEERDLKRRKEDKKRDLQRKEEDVKWELWRQKEDEELDGQITRWRQRITYLTEQSELVAGYTGRVE